MKFLINGEPQDTFKPNSDTGVLLAYEILNRGYEIYYCSLSEMNWREPTQEYLSHLKTRKISKVTLGVINPFTLENPQKKNALEFDIILQRKDPPVDENYEGFAKHFATLPKNIIQMNNPEWTPKLSEHLLPQEYPEYSIPTFVIRSIEELLQKAKEINGKIVAKPKNLFSGIGIAFFEKNAKEKELIEFWEKWKPEIIIQPFISEIETIGDLRILVMNQKTVGSVLRKPKKGSLLGNLHQGATPHPFDPTSKQIKAVEAVSKSLTPKGLYLLGIDFIGDFLTEINITCPTTVPQINQVMKIQGEKLIVDELIGLRRKALNS